MSTKQAVNIPFSILFALSLIGALSGTLKFFGAEGLVPFPALVWKSTGALTLLWILWSKLRLRRIPRCSPGVFFLTFILLLFSDFVARTFTFFPGTEIRALVIVLGLFLFFAVQTLVPLTRLEEIFSERMLLFFQCLLALLFFKYAHGRLLFSDDHPSFLYRLHLLREHFPLIPFYNTDWNAGYQAREFFPSGVLNVFFLAAPFLYLLPDIGTLAGAPLYTYLIPYLSLLIIPLSVYVAGRLLSGDRNVGVLAALLSLAPSMGLFEWLLKYGTLGFITAAGLVPLTFALAVRLVSRDMASRWSEVFALLIVSFLCLQWTLTALVFLPLVLWALWNMFRWNKRKWGQILVFVLLAVLLNLPWAMTFVRESKVLQFISGSTLPGVTAPAAIDGAHVDEAAAGGVHHQLLELTSDAVKHLRPLLVKVNPLLLLMALPGFVLLSGIGIETIFFLTIVWLLLVAGYGGELKPQLELKRMVIPLAFLLTIPAAAALLDLLKVSAQKIRTNAAAGGFFSRFGNSLLVSLIFGSILISPIVAASAYLNRSSEHFIFAPDELQALSETIRTDSGEGRTFFLGFILQDLGSDNYGSQNGGHIAPLAAFSGKEIYASDYYHRYWTTVDPIPKEFRDRGEAGIEEFLDLLNVTAVVTFKREWADYCLSHARYAQLLQAGRFRIFQRKDVKTNYLYRGTADVRRIKSGLSIVPHSAEVVLRYRYLPQLKLSGSPGWELFPVPVFQEDIGGGKRADFSFIGLRRPSGKFGSQEKIELGF